METAVRNDVVENRRPSVFKRILAVLLVTVLLLGAAGFGGLYVLLKGPSPYAGGLFAAAVADTAVGEKLLGLFLTPEELEQRLQTAQEQVPDQDGGEAESLFSVYPALG